MYTKESVDKGRKERLVIDQTRNQSNLETRFGKRLGITRHDVTRTGWKNK